MTKPQKLTENDIELRVVPTSLRWPSADIAKTVAWDRSRECVDALRGLLRAVDDGCTVAEQDVDLSPQGIGRRRAELGRQALSELKSFKPFQLAEMAVRENIKFLEERMTALPQQPTSVADVALAQEIRQHVRAQKSPIDLALKSISDPRILGAILNAPAFLSGLSEVEWKLVRERARTSLHPEQAEMQQHLSKALDDLREGVAATKRAVTERCQTPERPGELRSHTPGSRAA